MEPTTQTPDAPAPLQAMPDEAQGSAAGTSASGSPVYVCPTCSQAFQVSAPPANGLLQCPACGAQFFALVDVDDDRSEADRELEERDREAELSGLRIQQLSALRRGIYRSRSHCVVAAVGCVVVAAHLIWMAVRYVHSLGWHARPVGYLFASAAALLGCWHFIGRVAAFNRELAQTHQVEPDAEPDFSALSDGSQRWDALERMQEKR